MPCVLLHDRLVLSASSAGLQRLGGSAARVAARGRVSGAGGIDWHRLRSISGDRVAQDTVVARPWRPERGNRVAYGGSVAMVGGPDGRYLPEHARADLPIPVRFGSRRTAQLVEPHAPHCGG